MARKTAINDGETFPGSSQPEREREQRNAFPPPVFTQFDPRTLKPHQKNSAIYGEDEDATELIELIRMSGWVKPLVVTRTGTIISGHQRCKAVLELGWESIQVEVREFPDELAELEALLLENASRSKTTEQKVREGEAWKEIEAHKARIRQISLAGTRPNSTPDLMENFPQGRKGTTRDHIADRVGIGSGRTYQKAVKVVTQIDSEASLGHKEVAQVLRLTLNEQSVDSAHALLKRPPEELMELAELITSGKAKSTRQAAKMIKENNSKDSNNADFSDPYQPSFAGFSIGDWVEVSAHAHAHNLTYIGQRGRVDQILAADKLFSVSFEGSPEKIRFEPSELCLLVRSAPQTPVRVGDIVFVRIERHEAASPEQKKWNGFWGKVAQIGEMGSLKVDMGSVSLQLFPRDVNPVDAPSNELRHFVERVLHLRRLELDEAEVGLLDLFQRREWLTPRQLDYLQIIEKFHVWADSPKTELHQVVQFRGR